MSKYSPEQHIAVSPAILERVKSVREYTKVCSETVKELLDLGVEIEYFHNGQKLPDGVFGLDFEIRMHLPVEPIKL